ncbi:leucine rich repeat LRR-containing protein [Nitzschia inconspicua]|uniref:Leucine rich repeat LRR-containing protein n=2 Tax=Nitzschia inconspicua TaxID=303405 RepID=A0A9K3M5F8_9STRA|nr:leucine rich repeat LRR-containing protein [Nitzschia inconspicua]
MVLIDGHDSAWQRKFQTVALAVCRNSENLADVPKNSTIAVKNNPPKFSVEEERNQRKIIFMHLNLGHVPWEQLPLQTRDCQEKNHDQPKCRFLAIEVIDCTALEMGLPYIFKLPLQHLYISTPMTLRRSMGRILAKGLQESNWFLQKFQLSSATFTIPCMDEFARGLVSASSLQELDFSYCLFQGLETTLNDAQSALVKEKQIHSTEACMTSLAGGLSQSSIFCLKLNRCQLRDTAVANLILHGLSHNGNLQELFLGGNHLNKEALSALGQYLGSPLGCSLVTLGLSIAVREGPDFILNNNNEPSQAQIVALQDNTTRENVLSCIYPALFVNKSLRVLHLSSNGLKDDDIHSLCLAISQSQLSMLDLKSNDMTDYGAKILAEHLPPKLERLWLLGNPIGITGATALKKALERTHVNLIDLRIPIYQNFELVPELQKLQQECYYFSLLNQGGRRILLDEEHDNDHHNNKIIDSKNPIPLTLPLGLWALILARVNRIDFVVPWGQPAAAQSPEANRVEVLYYLLANTSMLRQHR